MKKPTLTFGMTAPLYAVLGVMWLAATGFAQQANQPPAGPPPKLTKIRDSLYLMQNQAANLADLVAYGGNLTIYLTDQGVILVDSKFERNHNYVVSQIKSLTDKPVKYVILTHNHADHAGGAAKLEADGAQVIISNQDRENLVKAPNQSWLPALTYSGRADLYLGGRHVQLLEARGHTRGDTIVSFPAERVVCAGDLVTTPWDAIPLIVNYGDGGNWTDWGHSISELLAMDWDVLIPGHGPAINKQQLSELYGRMNQVIDRFRQLNREKKTQEEITQTLVKEFQWGTGPAAGLIPGMMAELR